MAGANGKRGDLTGILRSQQLRWSLRAGTSPQRWPGALESIQGGFISGRSNNGEKAFSGKGNLSEMAALRRKLREVEMERDILKKAVGIFSKTTENGSDS